MRNNPIPPKPYQFSLRSLFWLTALVSVVLGTMTTLGRTQSFRALGSVHALLALLPIAAVWAGWRYNILTGRRTTVVSLLLYISTFALPFLRLEGSLWFGSDVFLWSLISVFAGSDYYMQVLSRTSTGWIGYCLITLSNATYLYAFLHIGKTPDTHKIKTVSRFTAMACSLVALALLCASNAIDAIYIGYGVWVAAMLAMWLAVREEGVKPLIDADDR